MAYCPTKTKIKTKGKQTSSSSRQSGQEVSYMKSFWDSKGLHPKLLQMQKKRVKHVQKFILWLFRRYWNDVHDFFCLFKVNLSFKHHQNSPVLIPPYYMGNLSISLLFSCINLAFVKIQQKICHVVPVIQVTYLLQDIHISFWLAITFAVVLEQISAICCNLYEEHNINVKLKMKEGAGVSPKIALLVPIIVVTLYQYKRGPENNPRLKCKAWFYW